MSSNTKHGHAIVLGASVAGLLAARVLSESYEKVTIFDRDELPTTYEPRKGVPQGDQPHGMLARGVQILDELFEGFTADLTAAGGVSVDLQRDMVWINEGNEFPRVESGIRGLSVSRPALEGYVRERVRALSNVDIKDRHEALGLRATEDRTRITGVRVLARGGVPEDLDADLVIDATGRSNRGAAWLADLGYGRPDEDHLDSHTVYVTREYRRVEGQADFAAIIETPWPANPYGGIALSAEGDRWMATLWGVGAENIPPLDPEGYLEAAKRLPNPEIHRLLSVAEPLGLPYKLRLPVSVWRHYERMARLPERFVAIGDAVCAFNPAYGQGMTVAAIQAYVLRDALTRGIDGLPRRFYRTAAKSIAVPWDMAVGSDLRYPHVVGPRTRKTKFINAYIGRLLVAGGKHATVARAFLRVANLLAPPQTLFAPNIVFRVLLSGGRRSAAPAKPVAQEELSLA